MSLLTRQCLKWPSWNLAKVFFLLKLVLLFVICLNVISFPNYQKCKNDMYLSVCPRIPPNLHGRQNITTRTVTIREAEGNVTGMKQGGFWSPQHCQPRWRVAIIVPYRNRPTHIGPFLLHMHLILQRQELNYSIYIVEQEGNKDLFNRGRLLNVGYLEAQREGPWDCVAFHDVDTIPEDDRHLYHCSQQPRHLGISVSKFKYELVYPTFIGVANLMTKEQVESVNGWSNMYWGWGGEDDDMMNRIISEGWEMWRYPANIALYKSFSHKQEKMGKDRFEHLNNNKNKHQYDGLNNLEYNITNFTRNALFTHIVVNIGSSASKTLGVATPDNPKISYRIYNIGSEGDKKKSNRKRKKNNQFVLTYGKSPFRH